MVLKYVASVILISGFEFVSSFVFRNSNLHYLMVEYKRDVRGVQGTVLSVQVSHPVDLVGDAFFYVIFWCVIEKFPGL